MLAHDANLTPRQQQNLETINRSGEHLLALINDVLEFSKIEAGRMVLQEQDFDLYDLLEGLETMFRLRAQTKGLTLTFARAPETPQYIHADQGKVRQVLINLLSNAVKFTAQGNVMLRVKTAGAIQALPPEGLTRAPAPRSLIFEVHDTGAGIAAAEIHQLFDAFVQTASGRQSQQGTGLGLALSRAYVQLMGGQLTVSSQPGIGSLFSFDLPIHPTVQPDAHLASESHQQAVGLMPGQPVYRLLIAEDIEVNRRLLSEVLRSIGRPVAADGQPDALSTCGFEIREAANGQETLSLWEQWRPHLIWMDLRMPVMDGYEATRQIRAAAEAQPLIIALTAAAFEQDRQTALAEGCDDFIRKPFRKHEVVNVLRKHLGVHFVYQEATAPAADLAPGPEAPNLESEIQTLPARWWGAMREVITIGDVAEVTALVEQIQTAAPGLAAKLTEWATQFEYERIFELIEVAERPS